MIGAQATWRRKIQAPFHCWCLHPYGRWTWTRWWRKWESVTYVHPIVWHISRNDCLHVHPLKSRINHEREVTESHHSTPPASGSSARPSPSPKSRTNSLHQYCLRSSLPHLLAEPETCGICCRRHLRVRASTFRKTLRVRGPQGEHAKRERCQGPCSQRVPWRLVSHKDANIVDIFVNLEYTFKPWMFGRSRTHMMHVLTDKREGF